MTKKEIISAIKKTANITTQQAEDAWNVVWDIVSREEETQTTIGKFKWVTKPARTARHPKTGEEIDVPQKQVLTFKARKPAL